MFKVSKHLPGPRPSSLEVLGGVVSDSGVCPELPSMDPDPPLSLEARFHPSVPGLGSCRRLYMCLCRASQRWLVSLFLCPVPGVCPAWISVTALQLAAAGNPCYCEMLSNNDTVVES